MGMTISPALTSAAKYLNATENDCDGFQSINIDLYHPNDTGVEPSLVTSVIVNRKQAGLQPTTMSDLLEPNTVLFRISALGSS